MAEVAMSPEMMTLGKRRKDDLEGCGMGGMGMGGMGGMSGMGVGGMGGMGMGMESVRTKKVRVMSRTCPSSSSANEGMGSYSFADVGSEDVNAFVGSAFKRTRLGPAHTVENVANVENVENARSEQHIQYLKYHESVVTSLRLENQMSLARKDDEVANVVGQNKAMQVGVF
jgi:hypothetical protein